MWVVQSFTIDRKRKTPAIPVLHGPFDWSEDAQAWADEFLPGVSVMIAYMNSPFFDKKTSAASVPLLVPKE